MSPAKKRAEKPAHRAVPTDEELAAAKAERRGRAASRMAHVAERMGSTDIAALSAAMRAAIARESAPPARTRDAARAVATDNVRRWVPIGPSVARRGQADGRPRVTGRVRDLAVDKEGQRAYAATGKGGVWYTEDAGMSWRPVGGWVTNHADDGGISTDLSCGSILVAFGATAAEDYVMVGTGEVYPGTVSSQSTPVHFDFGGRGVLSGLGPTTKPDTESPFEDDSGVSVLESAGIFGLARDPAIAAADVGQSGDRVVASTSHGLFLGECLTINGKASWDWNRIAGLDPVRVKVTKKTGKPDVRSTQMPSEVQWIPVAGAADGRIVVAINEMGVAFSDQLGAAGSWTWIAKLNQPVDSTKISGRIALSQVVDGKMYVLLGTPLSSTVDGRNDAAQLRRIPNITRPIASGGPGESVLVRGAPAALWGTQLHWNQALSAERVGTADRIWMGGSGIRPYTGAEFMAAIYCFDVAETGTGAPKLTAIPKISGQGRTARQRRRRCGGSGRQRCSCRCARPTDRYPSVRQCASCVGRLRRRSVRLRARWTREHVPGTRDRPRGDRGRLYRHAPDVEPLLRAWRTGQRFAGACRRHGVGADSDGRWRWSDVSSHRLAVHHLPVHEGRLVCDANRGIQGGDRSLERWCGQLVGSREQGVDVLLRLRRHCQRPERRTHCHRHESRVDLGRPRYGAEEYLEGDSL